MTLKIDQTRGTTKVDPAQGKVQQSFNHSGSVHRDQYTQATNREQLIKRSSAQEEVEAGSKKHTQHNTGDETHKKEENVGKDAQSSSKTQH